MSDEMGVSRLESLARSSRWTEHPPVTGVKLLHLCDECGEVSGKLSQFDVGAIQRGNSLILHLNPPQRLCLECYHAAQIQAAQDGLDLACLLADGSALVEHQEPVAA